MSLTALVVSVNTLAREERRQVLELAGFRVFTATSFEEGRELLSYIRPDLLVADVQLEEYNGLHLASRARSESSRTRSLIMGYPDVVLEREAKAIGAWYSTSSDVHSLVETIELLRSASEPSGSAHRDC